MWPRPSAAMTPSTMDWTSAADSACSRRSSSKRSPSWRCIARSAWTRASMSGMPERGKRGGEPAAMARAADQGDAMAVLRGEPVHGLVPSGRVGRERLADQQRLPLEAPRDVSLEVPAQRALGPRQEDQDREDEDDDGADDQPLRKAHRA